MLPLAVFAILHSVVCTITEGHSFSEPYSPVIDAREPPVILTDPPKPRVPDIEPDVGLDPSDRDQQGNFLKPLNPDEKAFLEWSNRECYNGLALAEYFAYLFIDAVKRHKLQDAFLIESFTAESVSSLVHDIALKGHLSVGSPHADASAQVSGRAVLDNFCKVKKDTLLVVVPHFIGRYLFYRNALTANNVRSLSKEFFKITKQGITSVVNPNPTACVTAIGEAFIYFLKSLGLYTAYSTNMVSGWFANEWYELPL